VRALCPIPPQWLHLLLPLGPSRCSKPEGSRLLLWFNASLERPLVRGILGSKMLLELPIPQSSCSNALAVFPLMLQDHECAWTHFQSELSLQKWNCSHHCLSKSSISSSDNGTLLSMVCSQIIHRWYEKHLYILFQDEVLKFAFGPTLVQ